MQKLLTNILNSKLKGNPKTLYDAAGHLIVNGGKRLRPYMVIKSCQILDGKVSRMPYQLLVRWKWSIILPWSMMI